VTRTASQVLERARKGLGQLPQLGRALVLVWGVAPRLTTVWAGLLVVQGLLPVAAVYLTRALVDSLVLVMGSGGGWARVRAPILLAASLAGVVLLSEVLQAVGRWIRVAQAEAVKDRISTLLHEKAVTADLAYYESPEYFDQLHLIRYEVYQRPTALLENVGALMQNTLTLVAMLVVLVRFNATFAENIALGDLTVDGGAEGIGAAARAAGADEAASRLPQGYHTLLGKWFEGGAELSVGEWQRVALARAFYRQAPMILLDEPTSAMDSWAENDWMSRFRALAEGRTALVITHRFTTAMRADVIHVMHAGCILESGTHRELVVLGGRYAASWEAQMRHAAEGPGAR
jgi:ABC-type multidrug transport system fused ATPase/permease subunit